MKTITIEKGQVAFYSSLSADTLVVNGILKVNGTLKVRRLLGRGIVDARHLEADTVNIRTGFIREVEIGSGTFGELYGSTCSADGTLCARNFIQALEVSAKRLTAPFRKLMKPKKKAVKKPALSLPKEPTPKPETDNELVSSILEVLREKGYTVSRVQEAEPASELAA